MIEWQVKSNKKICFFQSGGKCYYKGGQLRQLFISKWGKRYFKVGQVHFFKVGQSVYLSGAVIFQNGQKLFQSEAVILKWDNYFQVGHNACANNKYCYNK